MRRWFSLPQRDDSYETFTAHVLHYTLLILLGITVLFVFFATSPWELVFFPAVVSVMGACYYLLHTGRLRLASLIFLCGLWLVITLASFSINGLRNASISSYVIIIIYSAVLLSSRAAAVFTALSVFSGIILAVGEVWGVLPLRTTPLYLPDRFFQQVALFVAAGVLLSRTSTVIRSGLQRVREHEQLLIQRNRELELEIAERQRTAESLRLSEEKYRLLFENIPIMALVYALDGEILLLNNAAAHVLGDTPQAIQGRNIRDVLSPEDAEGALEIQAQVIAEGQSRFIEGEVKLPSGYEMYYLRHMVPLPNSDTPDSEQVLVLTTDVTEKYLAEQRERELAQAQARNAFLTDFFSTISHDLKTPLTIMNTSLYLFEHAQTHQMRAERIAQIRNQIALIDTYIQDMLTISRLEHLPSFDSQPLHLNGLIEGGVALLRPRMENKQIACRFHQQPDLPAVTGDQAQLQRMLTNLIENAVNYTPTGGQVTIQTSLHQGRVTLEVQDNGMGIEADALPHIFDRFYRAPSAKASETAGTGLGLAIVKKIVEMHNATIEVQSQSGQGTTFRIQFPDAQQPG